MILDCNKDYPNCCMLDNIFCIMVDIFDPNYNFEVYSISVIYKNRYVCVFVNTLRNIIPYVVNHAHMPSIFIPALVT